MVKALRICAVLVMVALTLQPERLLAEDMRQQRVSFKAGASSAKRFFSAGSDGQS